MTKRDIKLILVLCLIAVAGFAGYYFYTSSQEKDLGAKILVYYKSEVVHEMYFNQDETYELDGDYGHMVIEVKDGTVGVKEVECPNQICYYTGYIEQGSGLTILCVPNDIIIREDPSTASSNTGTDQ